MAIPSLKDIVQQWQSYILQILLFFILQGLLLVVFGILIVFYPMILVMLICLLFVFLGLCSLYMAFAVARLKSKFDKLINKLID